MALKDARETPQGRIDGWTIVDCGNDDDATRAAWSRIFSSCLNNLPVLRIMTTHCHPDHIGLADWLCAQWQAPLWATPAEYGFACMMSAALRGLECADFRWHGAAAHFHQCSGFRDRAEADPLRLYLDSLRIFLTLPQDTLVLPSHGRPFVGLHARVTQLQDHHAARLAEVKAACRTPQSAADIVPIIFTRALDAHQLSFALGEALAHLHYLWFDGILQREFDENGVLRFRIT